MTKTREMLAAGGGEHLEWLRAIKGGELFLDVNQR
jgi:hypothetical protein